MNGNCDEITQSFDARLENLAFIFFIIIILLFNYAPFIESLNEVA